MDWNKIKMVAEILKLMTPIVWDIVDDIEAAKSAESDGGKKITRAERHDIIIENILDLPAKIEPIIIKMMR
jgi:hypothetical protein